ncbi:MAG: FkbM family methyltransferase [Acidimicrobiia bacterium]|nr:FkbM family methyltransferase [Acidimicrobiia bacterium]
MISVLLKSIVKRSPLSAVAHRLYYALGFQSQNAAYDQQTVEVMKRCLGERSIGVDVGANTGDILSEMVAIAPKGEHYVFEPIPQLARKLGERHPGLHVYEVALSDCKGESDFQHFVNMSGYSGLGVRNARSVPSGGRSEVATIRVRTDRLDDIVPADTKIDFMKLDIEGAEHAAMKGAFNTIVRSKPLIVFEASKETLCLFDVTPHAIYDYLTGDCRLNVSTMKRWLNGGPALSRRAFWSSITFHLDTYFIAYPENRIAARPTQAA